MMFGTTLTPISLIAYADAKREYVECKQALDGYGKLITSGLLMPWEISEFTNLQTKMDKLKRDVLPEINRFTEEVINKESRYFNIVTSYLNDIDSKLLQYLL